MRVAYLPDRFTRISRLRCHGNSGIAAVVGDGYCREIGATIDTDQNSFVRRAVRKRDSDVPGTACIE